MLLLLLLLLAQLDDPRQHLQPRDFLPADVSELSNVDVVELCCGVGVGVIVVVGGCRQHVADDFGFVPVDATFAVVVVAVVDSFVSLPGVVFRIFSSLAVATPAAAPCWDTATAHRGHSPTLNGCSSLCRRLDSSSLRSLNLSLISHTALAVTIRLGLTGPDGDDGSGTELPVAISCCWRSCCWCCCMVRFSTLALTLIVEVLLLSQIVVTEDIGGGVAEVVTARNVPGEVAHDGI